MDTGVGGRRVLVVDDDENSIKGMHRALVSAGFLVETALTVSDALERLSPEHVATAPVDHVITDLLFPGPGRGEDVVDAAQRLSAQPQVIVVSGVLDAARMLSLQRRSCVLSKPFGMDTLLEALSAPPADMLSLFAERHCLSEGERSLLATSVRCACLEEQAAQLGIATSTVRTVWNRIFKKAGCTSQRDVFALILRSYCPSGWARRDSSPSIRPLSKTAPELGRIKRAAR